MKFIQLEDIPYFMKNVDFYLRNISLSCTNIAKGTRISLETMDNFTRWKIMLHCYPWLFAEDSCTEAPFATWFARNSEISVTGEENLPWARWVNVLTVGGSWGSAKWTVNAPTPTGRMHALRLENTAARIPLLRDIDSTPPLTMAARCASWILLLLTDVWLLVESWRLRLQSAVYDIHFDTIV